MSDSSIDPLVLDLTRWFNRATPADIIKLFTESELPEFAVRRRLYEEIAQQVGTSGALSYPETARIVGCSPSLVGHAWKFLRKRFAHSGDRPANFRLVIPSEARASDQVDEILAKAGFAVTITNNRIKTGVVIDMQNGIAPIPVEKLAGVDIFRDLEYNRLTPFDLAFVGKDIVREYETQAKPMGQPAANVDTRLTFHCNRFRMCIAVPQENLEKAQQQGWDYFQNQSVVTSYPETTRTHFKEQGVTVTILDAKGGVEAKCRRWGAVAIVDVVETGESLKATKLAKYGDPFYEGNISLIQPVRLNAGEAQDPNMAAFLGRLAQAYPQPYG